MPSILVVEQEPHSAERINSALSAEGWRVRVVPGADQALQSASAEAPDLVLLSSAVPGAEAVAHFLSRGGGGPGVLALLAEDGGNGAGDLRADHHLAKPFSDQELVLAARRALLARPQAAPAAPPMEHKLTSQDIFGDVLAEFEDAPARPPAPVPVPPPAPVAPPPAPRPAPAAAASEDDEISRRLEKTLSGVFGAEPRPRPQPAAPPAQAAPPAPARPAAPAPAPTARKAEPLLGANDVDALLSKTLSNLDLGRARPGAVRPPVPAAPPQPPPAAAAPPVQPEPPRPASSPPPATAAPPPPPVTATPPSEGTAVRKAPRPVGDFDFSELEELARTGVRRPDAARPAVEPPRPAAPAAPPQAPPPPEPVAIFELTPPPADALRLDLPELPPLPEPPPPAARPPVDFAATQRIPVLADEPGERFGQYTLLERIAVGGMAEVWKARMRGVEGFQKTVAIKRILPHMTDNAEFVGMFIDEAKLAAQLSHPNIVHIYDLGKIGRDYYIAMEYVEGRDLRSLLNAARKKGLRLPLGLALLIAARLASALDYAHRKRDFEDREMGLVHRDVSPQNVLLTSDGDVKLCDFGIAKAVSKASHTQVGALKGKLQYMSPEQAWGRPIDGRSDIFSLGAVLFEMVTGERLFPGDSELSVLEAVRQGRIRSPRQVDPSIPPEVDEIVTRALAIEPQDRFASAGEMKQRIEAALAALSPSPGPTDLAAFIQRVLSAEPVVEKSEPAVPPAPPPFPPAAEEVSARPEPEPPAEMAPVAAVAPIGEVLVEEETGRKSRSLLYAAIAALIVVAVLTFLFLNSRRKAGGEAPESAPAQSQGPAAATPGPGTAVLPAAQAPGGSAAPAPVDMSSLAGRLDEQLAKREEELRRKLEAEEARLKKELEKSQKESKPDSAVPAPQAAPPEPPPPAPEPEPSPRQAESQPPPLPTPALPEPQPEPEPQKPQAQERVEPEPSPEAPRVRVGELVEGGPGVVPPQLVSFPKPEYPPVARNLRVEGIVVVSVLVDENGKVQDVRMAEPIKQKVGINEAAIAAARNARYRPATKEGVRVKMWTRLRIPFKL
jgi:TonB family protein